jgi:hypothetical protein
MMDLEHGGYIKYQASHAIGIQLDVLSGVLEGNHEKAFESTIKAHAHHAHATEHQNEDLKQHA